MRYAITGATGFVGGRLAALLLAEGHDVVALVRGDPAERGDAVVATRTVPGALDDDAALDRLLDGADGLFHVAGWYRLGDPDPTAGHRVNVAGTRHVLAAARRARIPRVVYTSTLAVNSDTRGAVRDETFTFTGRHLSVYDRTKAEAHRLAVRAASEGLPLVIAMPGLVYGPGDTSQTGALLRDVLAGHRTIVTSTGSYCWGFVDDVARGHLLAMTRGQPGESYMLAGPVHTLADGLRLAARLGGGRPPLVVPGAAVRALAAASDVVGRVLPLPPTLRAETLRAGSASYLGSPAKAQRELGWSARSLADGMSLTVRHLRGRSEPRASGR
jgi:nucleoside-diphosphate-sugar epimerase